MGTPDKIVLEHTGALGDFLLAWPAFLSIRRHFPDRSVYYAVPSSHAPWLAPLARPCPPEVRRALDARFEGGQWPKALEGALVVRPGLGVRPDLPDWEGFWYLPGIAPGRSVSPTELYREALAVRGIPLATEYPETFRTLFGSHAPPGDRVLLFPGAGHRDKAWPLDRFEHLAAVLQELGLRSVCVIGPAEAERGIVPAGVETLVPETLKALSAALRAARFVVGPDCGPLHLAGLHGVPGLALFGPTSPRQWGPVGLKIVTAGLDCAPCTALTSDAFAQDCPRPLPCLDGITVAMVLAQLRQADLIPGRP